MRTALRIAAVAIAVAGFVDPTVGRQVPVPLSVEFRLPEPSHPEFARADALRHRLAEQMKDVAKGRGGAALHAIVAIGNAHIGDPRGRRVFAAPLAPVRPGVSISSVTVPRHTAVGQSAVVTATLQGSGLAGRTSTVTLETRGIPIAAAEHVWVRDEETFDARFSFAPPGPGLHRLRIAVSTPGQPQPVVADTGVSVRAEPLEVLVFEPRPSWLVTFVRRSLEGDSLFDVAASTRSSRPVVTRSGDAPASLRTLDADRYDALIVGGLDELQDGDLDALDRFARERGGTVILVPDRRVSAAVRRRLDLPVLEEALLEKPLDAQDAAGKLRASEFLLPPPGTAGVRPLATISQGNAPRPVVFVLERGAGRIVFSGALDAWRYRDAGGGFDAFWRSLVADAALVAPPRLDVIVEPPVARPGDAVNVSVDVRATEIEQDGGVQRVPPMTATLTSDGGRDEFIRLWPSARVGTFEAHLDASAPGRYTVTVSAAGTSTSTPFLVAEDVVRAGSAGRRGGASEDVRVADERAEAVSAAAVYAARATGGDVIRDPGELARALSAIDTGREERTSHPMRSAWWIIPFSLFLCAEWALRRRSGLK